VRREAETGCGWHSAPDTASGPRGALRPGPGVEGLGRDGAVATVCRRRIKRLGRFVPRRFTRCGAACYLDGGSCSSPSMLLICDPAIGPKPSLPGWSGIVTANWPTLFS
jgi:hypothetical protein